MKRESNSEPNENALNVHLKEFEMLKTEIHLIEGLQHQLLNYSIAIIGGTVTIIAFDNSRIVLQLPSVYLIAAILTTVLGWTLVETSFNINNLGNYIFTVLTPKIQAIVGNDKSPQHLVLKWEEAKVIRRPRLLFLGILSIGKFALPLTASLVFTFLFYFSHPLSTWTIYEKFLFWLTVGLICIIPLGGLINLPFLLHTRFLKLDKNINQGNKV